MRERETWRGISLPGAPLSFPAPISSGLALAPRRCRHVPRSTLHVPRSTSYVQRSTSHILPPALLLLFLSALCAPRSAFSSPPAWWTSRGVLSTGSVVSTDYAALNLGQLKWMATNACDELQANLPPIGSGAGSTVQVLVAGFSISNNYVTANVGQLKAVARPTYDRLIAEGFTNDYPWTEGTTTDDVDYAIANLGQLKHVFDFSLTNSADGDSIPDWWEIHWFGDTAQSGTNDSDADTLNNAQEFQYGTCPTNAQSDADGLSDADEINIYGTNPRVADTDGDGSPDNVEIAAGTDPLNAASHPASISGTTAYSGSQTGQVLVVAVISSNSWATNHSDISSGPGAYTIESLPNLTNYWLKAWRDADGDLSCDYWEPQGQYASNPVFLSNNLSGADITLDDPPDDLDEDALPDSWEMQWFGNTNQPAGSDFDEDGLNNSNEYALGTSPTAADSDADGLEDGVETLTGVYVGPAETGSNPLAADTDSDGTQDGAEVSARTDPNNPDTTPPAVMIITPAENVIRRWMP